MPPCAGESKIMAGFMLSRNSLRSIRYLDDLGLFDQAFYAPSLGLGRLAARLDLDQVAFLVYVVLVVGVILLRPSEDVAVKRMLDPVLNSDGHRVDDFVADHAAF